MTGGAKAAQQCCDRDSGRGKLDRIRDEPPFRLPNPFSDEIDVGCSAFRFFANHACEPFETPVPVELRKREANPEISLHLVEKRVAPSKALETVRYSASILWIFQQKIEKMLFIKPGIWAFSARCKNVPYSVSYPLSIHSHSTDWRRVLLPDLCTQSAATQS